MASLIRLSLIALAFATPFAAPVPAGAQPSAADWSALAELPDFSGVWVPDVADQRRKERNERPPWTQAAQQQIDFLFAEDHDLAMISIAQLIAHRRRTEKDVVRVAQARIPTPHGEFVAYGFDSLLDGIEHVALVRGDVHVSDSITKM